MTQAGISESIGTSKSHTSTIISKLISDGLIYMEMSRILLRSGATGMRKVYGLTSAGLLECRRIMDSLDPESEYLKDGMIPMNLNHCQSDMLDSLDREDRNVIGCLLVMEDMPVNVNQLPKGRNQPLVPINGKGLVSIKPAARDLFLSKASESDLKAWHSRAADWYATHGGPVPDHLMHLVKAGRRFEAGMLALSKRYYLMDDPREDVAAAMDEIDTKECKGMLTAIVALCYIRLRDAEGARRALGRMGPEFDQCLKGALEAEILLVEGERQRALDVALESYNSDAVTGLALGKAMAENHRYSEAAVFLRRARISMTETGCLFRFDEALAYESESYAVLGHTRLAYNLMSIAACATRNETYRKAFRCRAEVLLESEDPVGPEGVDI